MKIRSGQLDISERRHFERTVHRVSEVSAYRDARIHLEVAGEHVNLVDTNTEQLGQGAFRRVGRDRVLRLPRPGQRVAPGIQAAGADIVAGRAHADVVEAAVVKSDRSVAHDHVLDQAPCVLQVSQDAARAGELRTLVAEDAPTVACEDLKAVDLLVGHGRDVSVHVLIKGRLIGHQGRFVEHD